MTQPTTSTPARRPGRAPRPRAVAPLDALRLRQRGLSMSDICSALGASPPTVLSAIRNACAQLGISEPPRVSRHRQRIDTASVATEVVVGGERRDDRPYGHVRSISYSRVLELHQGGMADADIARELGCSRQGVGRARRLEMDRVQRAARTQPGAAPVAGVSA